MSKFLRNMLIGAAVAGCGVVAYKKLLTPEAQAKASETANNLVATAKNYIEENNLKSEKESDNVLRRLLLWESLENIVLQNNYLEGELPDFKIGVDGVRGYTAEDLVATGDTLSYLVNDPEGQKIPRILPNLKRLSINLNFFTGELPNWVLYHPHLKDWLPEILFYPQEEKGVNSKGKVVGFSNVPKVYDYYYQAYPKYRGKYDVKNDIEEE